MNSGKWPVDSSHRLRSSPSLQSNWQLPSQIPNPNAIPDPKSNEREDKGQVCHLNPSSAIRHPTSNIHHPISNGHSQLSDGRTLPSRPTIHSLIFNSKVHSPASTIWQNEPDQHLPLPSPIPKIHLLSGYPAIDKRKAERRE